MCGIVGFHEKQPLASPDNVLSAMLSHVRSRGPDGEGRAVLETAGGQRWRLGHRRLAIIDIQGGDQPMGDPDNSVCVVFNGELYNFQALREELARQGMTFRTRCDTEVLVQGYLKWGIRGLLARIEGMFAFALLDRRLDRCYLARDPYGQKPMVYAADPVRGLAFASSLQSILEMPWLSRETDPAALRAVVALRHIPAPYTAYRAIRKLRPGHFITYDGNAAIEEKYWEEPGAGDTAPPPGEDWTGALHATLLTAVEESLVSDVPLVLMLSSGLDSSLIAVLLAELGRARDVPAVTVGFRESSFDESEEAGQLAAHLGLTHHKILIEADSVEAAVESALGIQGEPFADPSLVPTLVLSRAVRGLAKVALGGDGGDEIFGGYPTFQAIRYFNRLNHPPLSALLRNLYRLTPVNARRYSLRYKLRRFSRGLGLEREQAFAAWLLNSEPLLIGDVLVDKGYDALGFCLEFLEGLCETDDVRLMSRQYLRLFLPGVLHKVDLASMHFGLEVRAPYLQPAVVRAGLGLPADWKVRGNSTKFILREILRRDGLLKHSSIPKRGFNVPLSAWIRSGIRPLAEPFLRRSALEQTGFFVPEAVETLWKAHLSGKEDHFDLLWSILTVQRFLLNQ